MAVSAHNIRLILEMIITSHTGIAHRVEHDAQGMPPHHGLLSVCQQSIIPECIALGKMSGGHYLPNRVTAYGPAP